MAAEFSIGAPSAAAHLARTAASAAGSSASGITTNSAVRPLSLLMLLQVEITSTSTASPLPTSARALHCALADGSRRISCCTYGSMVCHL